MEAQCDNPEQDHENTNESEISPLQTFTSAPSLMPPLQSINEGIRRSHTFVDGKYKCCVTSERLNHLRRTVETTIREHKIFTIKGRW